MPHSPHAGGRNRRVGGSRGIISVRWVWGPVRQGRNFQVRRQFQCRTPNAPLAGRRGAVTTPGLVRRWGSVRAGVAIDRLPGQAAADELLIAADHPAGASSGTAASILARIRTNTSPSANCLPRHLDRVDRITRHRRGRPPDQQDAAGDRTELMPLIRLPKRRNAARPTKTAAMIENSISPARRPPQNRPSSTIRKPSASELSTLDLRHQRPCRRRKDEGCQNGGPDSAQIASDLRTNARAHEARIAERMITAATMPPMMGKTVHVTPFAGFRFRGQFIGRHPALNAPPIEACRVRYAVAASRIRLGPAGGRGQDCSDENQVYRLFNLLFGPGPVRSAPERLISPKGRPASAGSAHPSRARAGRQRWPESGGGLAGPASPATFEENVERRRGNAQRARYRRRMVESRRNRARPPFGGILPMLEAGRLHLGQLRARVPSIPVKTLIRGCGAAFRRKAPKVGDLRQPAASHSEDAESSSAGPAVLDRAQDTGTGCTLALEIQHGVEFHARTARPGDLTLFGDMADKMTATPRRLAKSDQSPPAGPVRPKRARPRLVQPERLDRIDDGDVGALGIERGRMSRSAGLGAQPHRRIAEAMALRRIGPALASSPEM